MHPLHVFLVLVRHLRPGDQVDDRAEERDDEDQDHPSGLGPSGEVPPAEDVREHGDEDPDRHEPEEEDEHGPQDVPEGPLRCQHVPALPRPRPRGLLERVR